MHPPAPVTAKTPRKGRGPADPRRLYRETPYGGFPYDRARFNEPTLAHLERLVPGAGRVLDAGCGTGDWMAALAGLGCPQERLLGMDFSPEAVRAARSLGFRAVVGNLLGLPLRCGSFDLVFCSGVVHHTGDSGRAFRELARILRPGGFLLVEVYNAWHPYFYLVHRAMLPARFLYWRGRRWVRGGLRLLCAAVAQPLSLLLHRRLLDRRALDTLVADQVLVPEAELFTRRKLLERAGSCGLELEEEWTKQWGLMRCALFRKAAP